MRAGISTVVWAGAGGIGEAVAGTGGRTRAGVVSSASWLPRGHGVASKVTDRSSVRVVLLRHPLLLCFDRTPYLNTF